MAVILRLRLNGVSTEMFREVRKRITARIVVREAELGRTNRIAAPMHMQRMHEAKPASEVQDFIVKCLERRCLERPHLQRRSGQTRTRSSKGLVSNFMLNKHIRP